MIGALAVVIPQDITKQASPCIVHNDLFCWDWVKDNWSGILWPRTVEHVELTVIAILIGFVISFALALLAFRLRWVETPITIATGLLYTIPSLALFQLLVPATGLTRVTIEIALVSYTLLILFRNILIGLRGVPPDVRDAATGMGLTPGQTLWRVELPLALPSIFAGLRIAVVTIISLATVATFIVHQGLGAPIFDAISASLFKTEMIAAGGLAVLLAVGFDGLLVLAQRLMTPWARARRAP
jgi:osmoprotectant transport system permease protein